MSKSKARPTYNHTRSDSALYPCAKCAKLQTPAERARAKAVKAKDEEE